jgi:hypothetical protein
VRRDTADNASLTLSVPESSRENRLSRSRSPRDEDAPPIGRSDETGYGDTSARERRRTREVSLTTEESKGEEGVYSRRSRNLGIAANDSADVEKREEGRGLEESAGSESYRERRRARDVTASLRVDEPLGDRVSARRSRTLDEKADDKVGDGDGGESWRDRRRSQRDTPDKPDNLPETTSTPAEVTFFSLRDLRLHCFEGEEERERKRGRKMKRKLF